MEEFGASIKDTTVNSQISYTPFGTDKKRCTFKELCKNKPLFITAAALLVIVPLYYWYHRNNVIYPSGNFTLPDHWIQRAIYYNTLNIETTDLNRRLVCYYTFPNPTQSDALTPDQIDPNLCTHINVGFARISNNSLYLTDQQLGIFNATIALKTKNPKLKVLVSIGGAGDGSGFPSMVVNHDRRKHFIKSVDDFVRKYKCDGIDLDWEFPNRVPSSDDKQRMHFTQLLDELRKEINRQRAHKFIVSVAVAAPKFIIDLSYDVAYMNNYVDFVNVMTYDFHFYTRFTPLTGMNAPLYPSNGDLLNTLNINYSVSYWMDLGMAREKINVGLPTYGHTFELFNENNNGLEAPAKGYGGLGSNGFADYNQICQFLLSNGDVKVVFDYASRSPYASKGTEWVSYDDETSLLFKAQYVNAHKFGGAMILSLNADDYSGRCNDQGDSQRFPLTNLVKNVLSNTV